MKFYLAPLEGITNLYYRKYHNKYFNGIDKYFIPFLNPAQCCLSTKDKRELNKNNNNINAKIIPQIISKNSKETLWLISLLEKEGYDEINLNFGCPSSTVISKSKGAGILKDLNYLDNYLNEIFNNTNVKISIKLRLGLNDVDEFDAILNILNKYNIYEVIIHPRTAKEKYQGPLHLDKLDSLKTKTKFNIIYNGEIKTKNDIKMIESKFPFIKGIMIGRGIITTPDLLENNSKLEIERRQTYQNFFNALYLEYLNDFGWNNTKYYVKEILALMINSFEIDSSLKKRIFKANKKEEFDLLKNELFSSYNLKDI